MEIDAKVLEQITAAVSATVQPIADQAKAATDSLELKLTEQVSKLQAELDGLKAAPRRADGEGKPWEHQRGPQAPALVKELGDRPLMIVDVAAFMHHKGAKQFPLLQHVSQELEALGHSKSLPQSLLFPITWGCVPDDGERGDKLRKILRHALPIEREDESFARLAWEKMVGARKAMDPNDDTLGGSLIPLPPSGDIIDLFRKVTVMGQVGAEQITLPPNGSIRWPRETGTTTFYWLDANETITDSTVATGAMQMTAKRLGGLIKIPTDLIRYGVGVEGLLRRALALDAGLAEDLACLEGEGGGAKPLGILRYGRSADDTPEAGKITLHVASAASDGDTFTPEDPLQMIGLVETAPDAMGANAFVMRPMMFVAIANRRLDQGGGAGTGAFAFPDVGTLADRAAKTIRGLPAVTSTQINKTSRKGSGTTLTYILCGNFRRTTVARVGAIELAASADAGFAQDQIWLRAIARMDFGIKHPESLVITPTLLES